MAKKCFNIGANRFYCIETMTLFIVFLIFLIVCYLLLSHNNLFVKNTSNGLLPSSPSSPSISSEQFIKVPVNIETQNIGMSYQQLGILTKHGNNTKDGNPIILPLMGKKNIRNSNRWKYYTVHNGGSHLPISKGGMACTKEQGCDEIYSGDSVYVEGFQEIFIATVYDAPTLEYIPYITQ